MRNQKTKNGTQIQKMTEDTQKLKQTSARMMRSPQIGKIRQSAIETILTKLFSRKWSTTKLKKKYQDASQ